jgi:hypothetical protein
MNSEHQYIRYQPVMAKALATPFTVIVLSSIPDGCNAAKVPEN